MHAALNFVCLCMRGVWIVVYLCLPGALHFVCLFGVYIREARGPFCVCVCAEHCVWCVCLVAVVC